MFCISWDKYIYIIKYIYINIYALHQWVIVRKRLELFFAKFSARKHTKKSLSDSCSDNHIWIVITDTTKRNSDQCQINRKSFIPNLVEFFSRKNAISGGGSWSRSSGSITGGEKALKRGHLRCTFPLPNRARFVGVKDR